MDISLEQIRKDTASAVQELIDIAGLTKGGIVVIGCSTSEIKGAHIGKDSAEDIGLAVIEEALRLLREKGIYLAAQCCEHLNRALIVERFIAERDRLEIVSVIPKLHAGGAAAMAAYSLASDPVAVEHVTAQAGLDIGDTSIGMHVKFVQVPVRLQIREIGKAHLTALRSRPKLIGGERAEYK